MLGVYDSGLGGLSVLRELVRELPAEDYVYAADQAYVPYGPRPAGEIVDRAVRITDALLARGAKLVVVACNTATIAAVETLRAQYSIPFVGMEPAVKPAVGRTRTGVVGVLATTSSLGNERFHGLVARHGADVDVLTQPCPGLVEQVEIGDLDGPQTRALVERYTAPLLAARADVIVLGCTHYPLLRPLIADVVGPDVELIDTGAAVARRARALLERDGLLAAGPAAAPVLLTTSPSPDDRPATRLWRSPVRLLPLDA